MKTSLFFVVLALIRRLKIVQRHQHIIRQLKTILFRFSNIKSSIPVPLHIRVKPREWIMGRWCWLEALILLPAQMGTYSIVVIQALTHQLILPSSCALGPSSSPYQNLLFLPLCPLIKGEFYWLAICMLSEHVPYMKVA